MEGAAAAAAATCSSVAAAPVPRAASREELAVSALFIYIFDVRKSRSEKMALAVLLALV